MNKRLFSVATALLATVVCAAQKKPPRINHIALSVTQLERSRVFYQEVLGLDTIPEPFRDGRHVWFRIGDNSHLHIIQNPPPLTVPSKNTHLCLSVPKVEDLVRTLQRHKLAYEDWAGTRSAVTTRPDGVHQIYLQDPDGYWIEINDDFPK